jgi:hypothetical protein
MAAFVETLHLSGEGRITRAALDPRRSREEGSVQHVGSLPQERRQPRMASRRVRPLSDRVRWRDSEKGPQGAGLLTAEENAAWHDEDS